MARLAHRTPPRKNLYHINRPGRVATPPVRPVANGRWPIAQSVPSGFAASSVGRDWRNSCRIRHSCRAGGRVATLTVRLDFGQFGALGSQTSGGARSAARNGRVHATVSVPSRCLAAGHHRAPHRSPLAQRRRQTRRAGRQNNVKASDDRIAQVFESKSITPCNRSITAHRT